MLFVISTPRTPSRDNQFILLNVLTVNEDWRLKT